MAVTGVRQPNERILYDPTTDLPYYARFSYAFEGLDGSSGTPLEPGEIIGQCRNAEDTSTSTPLPPADDTQFNLSQKRVDVRRYNRQTGQARIVVEYGVRNISFGAAPDVTSESNQAMQYNQVQPYMLALRSATLSSIQNEVVRRNIARGRMRSVIKRLKTDEANLIDTITRNITENLGRLMPWRGYDRIIVGGGFQPISQTQGYATIVLDYMPPVEAVAQGDIVDENDYKNLKVDALLANQIYVDPPTDAGGTVAEDLLITYRGPVISTFAWLTS